MITLLAFVTVFAVQTFDDIAVLRAGANARSLPLGDLFEGLEQKPGDPAYWWVWLTLFSTLIPSALNFCVAAPPSSAACRSSTPGLSPKCRWAKRSRTGNGCA